MSTIRNNPRRLVIVSDYQEGCFEDAGIPSADEYESRWRERGDIEIPRQRNVAVEGSYVERLPLACLRSGLVDKAEVWTHWRGSEPPPPCTRTGSPLARRSFRINGPDAPFNSNDMLGFIKAFGAPDVLCVWGLGLSEEIMVACKSSFKIYNSIDAPALRIPPEVSRHFDLVLTGAEWQSREIKGLHPGMATLVLPIGPEFASETMFKPLGLSKVYDVIYVAAAQPYKRHDILFEALARSSQRLKALCVCGYGDMIEDLKGQANCLGLEVDFIDPPGVPYDEVNRLMNLSRLGVVCGINDGAPAILTEYMLAGLPVLANAELTCGLQYILPGTGRAKSAAEFHHGFAEILDGLDLFAPCQEVLERWVWPHSIEKLTAAILSTVKGKQIFGG
ncbi:glycosyltransferase [Rhizobium grahamii]|nr:glycosyltransferase [Rhizobium grahamii]